MRSGGASGLACAGACAVVIAACSQDRGTSLGPVPVVYDVDVAPILQAHCAECHGDTSPAAGWSVTTFLGTIACVQPSSAPATLPSSARAPILAALATAPHVGLLSGGDQSTLANWVTGGTPAYVAGVHDPSIIDPRAAGFHGTLLGASHWSQMLDATAHSDLPLTVERLWDWNSLLLQKRGRSWRDDSTGPMQVVSGPIGKERVHFQGPPAVRLIEEMERFLDWFNGNAAMDGVMKAALAHLWFVTIHPFDDGNGRMARAIDGAQTTLRAILGKARFWESIQGFSLNERQRGVLNRLLDGFKGAGF